MSECNNCTNCKCKNKEKDKEIEKALDKQKEDKENMFKAHPESYTQM